MDGNSDTQLRVSLLMQLVYGDRAFPAAAARTWNAMPSADRAAHYSLHFTRNSNIQSFSYRCMATHSTLRPAISTALL